MKLFPETATLAFFSMDTLGPLPKPTQGRQFVLLMIDWYSRLTRSIFTFKATSVRIAILFQD